MRIVAYVLLSIFSAFCVLAVAQEQPKIKAAVSETIGHGFIIDEKTLRKLNELLRQRLSEKASHFTITYTVKFGNGFYYDTIELPTLLAEENTSP